MRKLAATLIAFAAIAPAAQAQWVQRKGPVLRATLPWEGRTVQEPTVLWDGHEYRMWYTGGWNHVAVGYAVSLDGIHWRKRPRPVIQNAFHANIVRTPNAYVATFASPNRRDLFIASSRDGIHFQPRQVLLHARGWESGGYANSYIWEDSAGWHLLYEAASPNYSWQMGLATGTRFGHWHTAASPLELGLHQLAWTAGGPYMHSGCLYFHAAYSVYLPTDIYRRCRLSLRARGESQWGPAQRMLGRSQRWEVDQVADPSLTVAGGMTLMFFDGMDNQLHHEHGAIGMAMQTTTPEPITGGSPRSRSQTTLGTAR